MPLPPAATSPDAAAKDDRPRCGPGGACAAGAFCGPKSGRCVANVRAVSAGARHTCALHEDGRVSCWGWSDAVKALGRAVTGPVVMTNLAGVTAITAGTNQTCALVSGRVHCFGVNYDFVVGEDDGHALGDVTAVALGAGFGCAAARAGTYCWGRNPDGQLARGLEFEGSANALLAQAGRVRLLGAGLSVVTVAEKGDQLCAWGNNTTKVVMADAKKGGKAGTMTGAITTPACRPAGDVAALAVGTGHACVRHEKGTFACWGERYYGQLGVATTETSDVAPPGQVTSLPAPVDDLVTGAGHTCALARDGRVFCFGLNSQGQVSEGKGPEQVRSPWMRPGLAGRVKALGSGSAAKHTCAVLKAGGVECWGNDDNGQLGDAPETQQADRFSHAGVTVFF